MAPGERVTPRMCLKYWPPFSGLTTCTDATLALKSVVPCSFLRTEALTVGVERRARTSTLLSRPYGRTAFGGAPDSGSYSSPALGSVALLMQMGGSGLQPPAWRAPETGTSREKTQSRPLPCRGISQPRVCCVEAVPPLTSSSRGRTEEILVKWWSCMPASDSELLQDMN